MATEDEGKWKKNEKTERRGGGELHPSWPSKRLYKDGENGRGLWRSQAICVIYEALWGIDGGDNSPAVYFHSQDTSSEKERLTAQGARWWGCGSRPELPASLLHTASLARSPYGSYRRRGGDDDDKLCAVFKGRHLQPNIIHWVTAWGWILNSPASENTRQHLPLWMESGLLTSVCLYSRKITQ